MGHEVLVERYAFTRAKAFLQYSRRDRWLSVSCGIASAIALAMLLLLLGLFVDLLVHRGRIPHFAGLSLQEQEEFRNSWKSLSDDQRAAAIQQLGFSETGNTTTPLVAGKTASDQYRRLVSAELFAPLPARANPADLDKWSKETDGVTNPYLQAMAEQEIRWRAYVWWLLRERVGNEAASVYQPKVSNLSDIPVPGIGQDQKVGFGALGTIVRLRATTSGIILGWIASWNPWMWGSPGSTDPNRVFLTGLLVVASLVSLARSILLAIGNQLAAAVTIDGVIRLRRAIYHHSLRLGISSTRGTSSAPKLFTAHIESVHEALYTWLANAPRGIAQVVILFLLALFISPFFTILFVLFALLMWMLAGQLASAFRRGNRVASRNASTRLITLLESLRMVRLVKAYLMELFNQSRVERQLSEYSEAHRQRYRSETWGQPLLLFLVTTTCVLFLYMAGRIVLGDRLAVAGLTVLVASLVGLYYPVRMRLDFRKPLRKAHESAEAIFEYLDTKREIGALGDTHFLQPMEKSLEFRKVTYQVPGSSSALLQDWTVAIKAGQKLGFVGTTDEQKQAIQNLLERFVEPTGGDIRIDGQDINAVSLESLRAQIGLVSSSQLIFNDTVANNIGCGDPSLTLPQIIEAAKLAHAHHFIQKLPYGYETPIGELGYSLSTGERFRIALARAILRDPTLYVIEEPSGPVDPDSQQLIHDTYARILADKTAILLPNDLATLKLCDKIAFVNQGRIEAIGTHAELWRTNHLYRYLVAHELALLADVT